jgi:CBS domain-containing protein
MAVNSAMPLAAIDAIVLDTETTGLDSRVARVIQIGAIRLAAGVLVKPHALDTLVDPGIAIPVATTAVHGITDAMVKGQPRFCEVVPALDDLLAGGLLIGHATAYDLAMLAREYAICGRPWRQPRSLDVRVLGRLVAPTLADHSLDRLCEWAGIEVQGRHTALGDAIATAEMFMALVPLLRRKGIKTLAEAEAACRRIETLENGAPPQSEPARSDLEPALVGLDSFAYRHRVADVMSAPAVFVEPELCLREVLKVLVERRISSVLIRNADGGAAIATERDLLRGLHEWGVPALEMPVAQVAKGPLETVLASDLLYRAIGRIGRLGFRHLGVTEDGGDIVGMVTTRNLLRHRASVALVLGDEMEAATDGPMLAACWARLPVLARGLLRDGVDARAIAGVVSAEILGLTGRAARIAEQRLQAKGLGPPPLGYAVLVLGSAGRGESLLSADQDNAIVFDADETSGPAGEYFLALGMALNDILDEAGLARCKGGVMAGNKAWCMSMGDWQRTIEGWIRRHTPQDLLNVDIFFDAFPAHGDRDLAERIWRHAYEKAQPAIGFQKLLTELARNRPPALTLFGNLKGDEGNRIDLKKVGLMPLFTCARVLSIRHGVRERSTSSRLAALPDKGIGSAEIVSASAQAQTVLMSAVLGQQLLDIDLGIPPSSKVDIGRLTSAERRAVKGALPAIDEIIGLVGEGRF